MARPGRPDAVPVHGRRVRVLQHPPGSRGHRPDRRHVRRTRPADGKRPVRELAGVDPRLNARWSSRAGRSTPRTAGAVGAVPARPRPGPDHRGDRSRWRSRPPWPPGRRKHEPRSLAEQRAHLAATRPCRSSAGNRNLDLMVADVSAGRDPGHAGQRARIGPRGPVTARGLRDGRRTVDRDGRESGAVAGTTVLAEATRQVRAAGMDLDPRHTRRRRSRRSPTRVLTASTRPDRGGHRRPRPGHVPGALLRADGTSVFRVAKASCSPPRGPGRRTADRRRRRPTDGARGQPTRMSNWRCWNGPPTTAAGP